MKQISKLKEQIHNQNQLEIDEQPLVLRNSDSELNVWSSDEIQIANPPIEEQKAE